MIPHHNIFTVQVEDKQYTIYLDDETYMLVSETLASEAIEYNKTFQ